MEINPTTDIDFLDIITDMDTGPAAAMAAAVAPAYRRDFGLALLEDLVDFFERAERSCSESVSRPRRDPRSDPPRSDPRSDLP